MSGGGVPVGSVSGVDELMEIDWNELWKHEQASRRPPDSAEYWDNRAPSFQKVAGTSPYAVTFLELAQLEPGETVFDMGCGSGTLALPLARAGHEVWAADFSEVMLGLMMDCARMEGIDDRIHPVRLAWDEDWQQAAAGIPVCGAAFASRSVATADLQGALRKVASKAQRRVCVTLGTNESPRCDDVITRAIGREPTHRPDFVYAMNILWEDGILPELRYICSARKDGFESFDAAVEKYAQIYNVDDRERELLIKYAREHLVNRGDGSAESWEFDHQRITRWAFLSWNGC